MESSRRCNRKTAELARLVNDINSNPGVDMDDKTPGPKMWRASKRSYRLNKLP